MQANSERAGEGQRRRTSGILYRTVIASQNSEKIKELMQMDEVELRGMLENLGIMKEWHNEGEKLVIVTDAVYQIIAQGEQ